MATNALEGTTAGHPGERVRTLIADNDLDMRVLLRSWLDQHGSFEVVEEAADGVEAVAGAARSRPQLVLLDLATPRMDGLEATTQIRRLLPHAHIVVRSGFSADRMAQRAIDAGADLYVEKTAARAQLLAVLRGLFPEPDRNSEAAVPSAKSPDSKAVPPLYELLLDALDDGVLTVDSEGRVTSANFSAAVNLGLPTSRLIGASLIEIEARARRENGTGVSAEAPDSVTTVLASGRPLSGRVLRLDKLDGDTAWLSFNVRPCLDEEGTRASAALVVVRDITETHELRMANHVLDARLRGIVDAVSTPLAVLHDHRDQRTGSPDFIVAHANQPARKLTGWVAGSRVPRDAVAGLQVPALRIDDDVVLAWQVPPSGPTIQPVEGPAQPSGMTELLEAAVASSPVGVILLDYSGRLVIANPVADRLLGGSALLGADPPSRWLRSADTQVLVREEDLPVRAACQGTPFDGVELFVADHVDATRGTYLELRGRPVVDAQEHAAGAVISVLDVTAAKEAEQALAALHDELRRSNTELVDFAAIASHDLAQPLLQISGFARLLQDSGLDDAHAGAYIDKIVVGCERMDVLIRALLTYSCVTTHADPFELVELTPLVDGVINMFEQQIADRGAQIDIDPLPTLRADRVQMRELFQNLIGNALKYVAPDVQPAIRVRSAKTDGEWQITVADNGIGIKPEDRKRAFAMFQRLDTSEEYPGTGIGLATCAKILERHHGRIWIDGNPSGGSSITFALPDSAPPRGGS